MIPKLYIAQWRDQAPWNTNEQVEQDLIISRTLVALFSDDFLQENLAFRGGTALHKLYLKSVGGNPLGGTPLGGTPLGGNPPQRYSEDIDLIQIKEGPIKPICRETGTSCS